MEEIPELEEVQKAIEDFQKERFLKVNDFESFEDYFQYFDEIFKSYFRGFHYLLQIQNPENFKFKFFRVREFNQIKNKNLFSEYSYPPAMIAGSGRCNFKNHPVFYCSNNPITALLEVARETDYQNKKKYCISTWSLIDNDQNFVFSNFLQSKLHPLNHFEEYASGMIKKIDETFGNNLSIGQRLGVIEYYKFIDSKFIEDTDYSISAYLSYKKMYADHNYASDMILYPSAQTESKSVNFAMHPNFVDNCMKIERFYIVEINNYDNNTNQVNLTFSKYGKIDKNIIFWKNLKPGDVEYEDNFKKDFSGYLDFFNGFNYTK